MASKADLDQVYSDRVSGSIGPRSRREDARPILRMTSVYYMFRFASPGSQRKGTLSHFGNELEQRIAGVVQGNKKPSDRVVNIGSVSMMMCPHMRLHICAIIEPVEKLGRIAEAAEPNMVAAWQDAQFSM